MDEIAQHELTFLFSDESDGLERVALRARALSAAREYDAETTAQFLHGFATIVREALAGESREARELYNDAAVQVLVAEGRSPAVLGAQLVTFGVLLGEEVAANVDPGARGAAVTWLATFMGEWTRELLAALQEAGE